MASNGEGRRQALTRAFSCPRVPLRLLGRTAVWGTMQKGAQTRQVPVGVQESRRPWVLLFRSRCARVHAVACASGSNEPQRPLQPRSGSNGDHKEAVRLHAAAAFRLFVSLLHSDEADAVDGGGEYFNFRSVQGGDDVQVRADINSVRALP